VSVQKTYWHLSQRRRMPSEYELVSEKLLYYTQHGFAVQSPVTEWYARYQTQSVLAGAALEGFQDPRRTTYRSYVALANERELFVDGLLATADDGVADRALEADYVRKLERVMAPLRYPCHGLQMVASYVGQMVPEGKVTLACLFQASDEMRRVHRLAYRLRQLQETYPGLGANSRETWQSDPAFQPLRAHLERLFVRYDWAEALIVLNAVLKPAFDGVCMVLFAEVARAAGDDVLAKMFFSLHQDCVWHRAWSRAFCAECLSPDQRSIVDGIIARARPEVLEAMIPLAGAFGADREQSAPRIRAFLEEA